MLFDDSLQRLLQETRSIAIVGAKDKPGQPVDRVGRYLLEAGFMVYPVHPVRERVWDMPAYKSLAELPCSVDIIDLFRAPAFCPDHAREVMLLPWKPRCFWMQSGISSPEAGKLMAAAGIVVVEDKCLMVEHRRLSA